MQVIILDQYIIKRGVLCLARLLVFQCLGSYCVFSASLAAVYLFVMLVVPERAALDPRKKKMRALEQLCKARVLLVKHR